MADKAPRYVVKPTVYRGNSGFSVRSGRGIYALSIFVRCRSTAVRIKKVLKAGLPHEERSRKIDMLIHADSRVKSCRR